MAIDPAVAIAAGQQEIAFAVLFAGEGIFSYFQGKDGVGGRPSLLLVLPLAIATGVAGKVIGECGDVADTALIGAIVLNGLAVALSALRFVQTPEDPLEWPGPKAWPAGITAASVLALLAGLQGVFN
eukprot:CAMPEP_0196580748 /NCGR_PEP_ID=MMETSP1081-20130531/30377_1 /TAXON_ID=36882 /ORGANISM="Pyramimonas amylifera, Strain CCMP720" /LENGTH=126 /DNA_ID=CAMNT_0041900711 /DNA_START=208 /DNA_END=588 /DNA_ORIENTATION=+